MQTSVKIGKIIGIPIKIHFSFLFILAIFAWALSLDTISIFGFTIGFGGLPISTIAQIALSIVTAILIFICVLLHELGHSYITQKYGIIVDSITLFVFGGISQSEEIPHEPKKEMKIAIIGPAVSLFLGGIFYMVYFFIKPFSTSVLMESVLVVFGSLSFYNFILAGFNLIPAFPIDGGRVLRAAFALKMKYQKATRTAVAIGKGFAVAMVIVGFFYNFWLILIAIFVYFGASQEERSTKISMALEDKQVKDVMKQSFVSVTTQTSINELYSTFEKNRDYSFPVFQNNELIGMVTLDDIKGLAKEKWDKGTVNDIMHNNVPTVSPDENAFSVFKELIRKNIDRFMVKERDTVVGTISKKDMIHAIQIAGIKSG
jgi:Zn-dependent protease/predicted transcriptional regulator